MIELQHGNHARSHIDFVPAFQPIVSLANHDVAGYEILCRHSRKKPKKNLRHNLHLDRKLLQRGLLICGRQTCNRLIFLNTSPDWFASIVRARECIQKLLFFAAENGIHASRLVVEINERVSHTYDPVLSHFVQSCKEVNIRIALDDFGSEFSNIHRIAILQPDFIKIDITILKAATANRTYLSLLHSIEYLAARIGSSLIIEGIESEPELFAAMDAGAAYAQGFGIERPLRRPLSLRRTNGLQHRLSCAAERFVQAENRNFKRYHELREQMNGHMQDWHRITPEILEGKTLLDDLSFVPDKLRKQLRRISVLDLRGYPVRPILGPLTASMPSALGRKGSVFSAEGMGATEPYQDPRTGETMVAFLIGPYRAVRLCLEFSITETVEALWFHDGGSLEMLVG